MTVIAIKPILLRDCALDIKLVGAGVADSYQSNVSRVAITPSTTTVRWRGMAPSAKFAAQTDPDWTLDVAYAQDWVTANALSQWLLANQGKEAEFTFRPVLGGKGHKVTAIVSPGPIGGDVDTVAVGTSSMGVIGVPTEVVAG